MDRGRLLLGAGHRHSARGAAAVEFALVTPVLLLILFGILQYGLYFHDSLTANEAVRSAARSAVVETASAGCAGALWSQVQCATREDLGRDDAVVEVVAPEGWAKGKPLKVCVEFPSSGGFGFLPLPHGGMVHAELQMSIENSSVPTLGSEDLAWC